MDRYHGTMNRYRTLAQSTPIKNLVAIWYESEVWDDTGILPDDATLRAFQAEAAPDVPVNVLQLHAAAAEVWREIAWGYMNLDPILRTVVST